MAPAWIRNVIPEQRACKLVTVAHLPGKASDEHLLLANANFTFPDAAKLRQPPAITRTTELELRNRNSIYKINFYQLSRQLSKLFKLYTNVNIILNTATNNWLKISIFKKHLFIFTEHFTNVLVLGRGFATHLQDVRSKFKILGPAVVLLVENLYALVLLSSNFEFSISETLVVVGD